MPFFAVLPTTPQVRYGINTAPLEPDQIGHREAGREADVEPTVAVQQGRVRPVQCESLLVGDEHRHARAVLARVEDLLGLVARWIEVDGRGLEDAGCGVSIPITRWRGASRSVRK